MGFAAVPKPSQACPQIYDTFSEFHTITLRIKNFVVHALGFQ